jgi:hypothetical protein
LAAIVNKLTKILPQSRQQARARIGEKTEQATSTGHGLVFAF